MSGQVNDKQRSSFVLKLHQLLSANLHPEYLHWIDNDRFAVTSVDSQARTALAPQWDFNSLSSFIRQLSYYSFKRLSDRRRSVERRPSVPSFIVFTHPSGNFVRDDESKTLLIPRKLRSRKPSSKRKASVASSAGGSNERSPSATPPPAPRKTKASAKRSPATRRKDSSVDIKDALQSYQLPSWNPLVPRSLPTEVSPHFSTTPLPPPPPALFPLQLPPQRIQRLPHHPQEQQVLPEPPYEPPYPTPVLPDGGGSYFRDHEQPKAFHGGSTWYYAPAPYTPSHEADVRGAGKVEHDFGFTPSGLVAPPSPPAETDPAAAAYGSPTTHAPRLFSAPTVGEMPPYASRHFAPPHPFPSHSSPNLLPPIQMQPANALWYGPS
ncbi:hypothetical protein JCM8115_002036 [Rhodotorula mucilaginosa]|uniref:HSF-type DNA-binding domain-containing protein n=1 Tax=Rhodotorula mucilaginosa TaxID=5537 RepID=A0A9P6VXW7_RHOMI|nr:hypothetical protein C6P46_005371 [Rhodotorula mucilaginosa]TKA57993.1 hypothetical protein B0A53_00395 [Rhodotorula sp. CCFEE 5036]